MGGSFEGQPLLIHAILRIDRKGQNGEMDTRENRIKLVKWLIAENHVNLELEWNSQFGQGKTALNIAIEND